ncbi:MAG TPA: hypothetical protein PKJ26_01230 [Candidatus Woesebacteria bacterium]|nr:hypothetical protein [Candidatus Woesebacteria bacterium]HNS65097.1 hypothetical protein [Candidatus Woesebacteria bacterium]
MTEPSYQAGYNNDRDFVSGSEPALAASLENLLQSLKLRRGQANAGDRSSSWGDAFFARERGRDRYQQFGEKNKPDPLFEQLQTINQATDNAKDGLPENSKEAQQLCDEAIKSFAQAMRQHSQEITPEMLMKSENEMRDVLDPASIFVLRAICGLEIMTYKVRRKIRDSWCEVDLPPELFDILLLDDDEFKREILAYRFLYPYNQLKIQAFARCLKQDASLFAPVH